MTELKTLKTLIAELSKLPSIGEKSAQRLAYFILKKGEKYSSDLTAAMQDLHKKIKTCRSCFSYTEDSDLCTICSDHRRDTSVICVVEEPFDIYKIESSQSFKGRYHVLHGTIAPLEGVQPDHLKIKELIARLDNNSEITEVILALDADIEGDTTALYLTKILQNKKIKTTRLAYGVPFGSDIDYVDKRTLGKAIENRVEI